MDEARIESLMRSFVEAGFSREQLTHWAFLHRASGNSDCPEHNEAMRRLVDAMGGPPTREAMRAWLDSTLAARDSGANSVRLRPLVGRTSDGVPPTFRDVHSATPDALRPGPHVRQQACPHCAAVTTQTQHGYSLSGRLWKGHVCTCHGWECRGCGVVLDPETECCR